MEIMTEDSVQVLYDLGLTRLQVQAFLALLKRGTSTPAQLARACSIHRVEGYRVMKELSRLGLVEQRLSDEKSTFSPVSPKSTLSSLISVKAEELRKLRERAAQCIPVLESLKSSGDREPERDKEARFRVTFGEKKSSGIVARMWRPARKEILVMLPKEPAHHFIDNPVHQRILGTLIKKQIKVKIIIELDQGNLKAVRGLSGKFDVRCCDQVLIHMTIVDGFQMILGGGYPTAKGSEVSLASLWTDSASFVYSMKQVFEELWKESFSVDQKIASMETGQSTERTEVVRSKAEIDRLFSEVVGRAKDRLLISLNNDSDGVINCNLKDLNAACKRGLRPKLLMKIDDHSRVSMVEQLLKTADVRHCQQIPFTALITDSEMIICTVMGIEPEEVLWITARGMVDKFYSVAKEIFREGKSASTRIWEVKTGTQIGEGLFRQLYTPAEKEPTVDQPEIETVLTRGEGRVYRKMPGITYYKSFDSRASKIEGGYAILEPGADSGFYFHAGEEVAIVVEGSLTIDVEKNTYALNRGDTLHFASHAPHRMRNLATNSENVRVFTVSYPPTF
jgi:sugar-specific transcriptional regulator TrmB/quercetin dioxygenase-like cupin family protein